MLSPGHGNTTTAQKKRKESLWYLSRKAAENSNRHCYLIYRYKSEIRVKEGWLGFSGVFYPKSQPYSWMTNIPREYGVVTSAGRILVKHEYEVLEAVEQLRNYYKDRWGNVCKTSSKTVENILECIEGKGYVIK